MGVECGAGIEGRWGRVSFAITDFYGYDDFPYTVRLSTYDRNVDWRSGRPRQYLQTLEQLADIETYGCASPVGTGVVHPVTPGGQANYTLDPTGPGTGISYTGAGNAGCLTRGATNRNIRVLSQLGGDGNTAEWSVP